MDKKEALNVIGPRQTILVTCRGKLRLGQSSKEVDEILPVTSHLLISTDPPMFGIALDNESDASVIIRESGVFCANFIPFEHVPIIEKLKKNHLALDKTGLAGLDIEECQTIDCFRIGSADSFFEIETEEIKEFGSRQLIIGRINYAEERENRVRLLHHQEKGYLKTTKG